MPCRAQAIVKGVESLWPSAGPDLKLPPCHHEDWWLDLSKVERAVYDGKRREMESAVELYVQARASADANLR